MALEQYQSEFTAEELEYAIRAVPKIGANGNWFIGDTDTGVFAGGVKVEGAEVGQTIVVKAVDENGKPTEWESAELPNDRWELIADVTTTEEVSVVKVTKDTNGNPFELKKLYVRAYTGSADKSTTKNLILRLDDSQWTDDIIYVSGGVKSDTMRSVFYAEKIGRLVRLFASGSQNGSQANAVMNTYSRNYAEGKPINAVRLFAANSINMMIGSKFEIWGVRV